MLFQPLFMVMNTGLLLGSKQLRFHPKQLRFTEGHGRDWIYMSDGDGNPIFSELNEDKKGLKLKDQDLSKMISFSLYTNAEPSFEGYNLVINDTNVLFNSKIEFSKQIKFVIHGWMSSNSTKNIIKLRDTYMERKDYNVILVDWSSIAGNPNYLGAVQNTKEVGRYVGKMIQFLVDNGAKWESFHLIGHSLGAHVSGFAGAYVKGKIRRITGLDPALPGFLGAPLNNRLDPSDAQFVDVIHTCAGALGYPTSLGTVDFYPNGGTPPQPGCFGPIKIIQACSHSRALVYFYESIGNSTAYPAYPCDSWIDFQINICLNTKVIPMGEEVPETVEGNYFLRTTPSAPYHAIERNNDLYLKFLGVV